MLCLTNESRFSVFSAVTRKHGTWGAAEGRLPNRSTSRLDPGAAVVLRGTSHLSHKELHPEQRFTQADSRPDEVLA